MAESEPTPVDELLTYLDGLGWETLYTAARETTAARESTAARETVAAAPTTTTSPERPRRAALSAASPAPAEPPAAARPPSDSQSRARPAARPPADVAPPPSSDGPQGGLFAAAAVSSAAGLTTAQRNERLGAVCNESQSCVACRLAGGRQTVVFGTGDPDAELMFIGEGPGADEDRQGEPFVGAAGQLLNKIIAAIDMRRDEVYICNMVKCRPPNNRDPQPDEMAACRGFLEQQIDLVQPRVIVTLGRVATQALLDTKQSLGRLRGRWHTVRGVAMRATYHPAALLRYTSYKRPTWEDMKVVRDHLQTLRAEGS
ncbi:MAG: uracil-DNA glycosylase [Acidobacteriota bacterium]